jgi:NAD(P)-dependent dehydrogenase (short-subunit alcohol dehydrogenase family)
VGDGSGMPVTPRTLFVGDDTGAAGELAEALGASVVAPPVIPEAVGWEWDWSPVVARWADELRSGPRVDSAVLCTWGAALEQPAKPLVELAPKAWRQQVELPLALWFTAVVAAAERCRDGGSVVVVVELPAALDGAGRADVTGVAEGLIALARSAALVHGERGVRVNVVATEIATTPSTLAGMAPALRSFPGRVAHEVAGAVRLLSSPDAGGVTGTVLRADCGRSW